MVLIYLFLSTLDISYNLSSNPTKVFYLDTLTSSRLLPQNVLRGTLRVLQCLVLWTGTYVVLSGFLFLKYKKGEYKHSPYISNFYHDQSGSIIMGIRSASTMMPPTNPTIRIVHVTIDRLTRSFHPVFNSLPLNFSCQITKLRVKR